MAAPSSGLNNNELSVQIFKDNSIDKWHQKIKNNKKECLYNKIFPLPNDILAHIFSFSAPTDYPARITINKLLSAMVISEIKKKECKALQKTIELFLFHLCKYEVNNIIKILKKIDYVKEPIIKLMKSYSGKELLDSLANSKEFTALQNKNSKMNWSLVAKEISYFSKICFVRQLMQPSISLSDVESFRWNIKMDLIKTLPEHFLASLSDEEDFKGMFFLENRKNILQFDLNAKNKFKALAESLKMNEIFYAIGCLRYFTKQDPAVKFNIHKLSERYIAVQMICEYLIRDKKNCKVYKAISLIKQNCSEVEINHHLEALCFSFKREITLLKTVVNNMNEPHRQLFRVKNFM